MVMDVTDKVQIGRYARVTIRKLGLGIVYKTSDEELQTPEKPHRFYSHGFQLPYS